MSHETKKKLARRMMTPDEIRRHVPIFLSEAWDKRKKVRHAKEIKKWKLANI